MVVMETVEDNVQGHNESVLRQQSRLELSCDEARHRRPGVKGQERSSGVGQSQVLVERAQVCLCPYRRGGAQEGERGTVGEGFRWQLRNACSDLSLPWFPATVMRGMLRLRQQDLECYPPRQV